MKWLPYLTLLLVSSCTVGPNVPKGQQTMQGRGAEALTNQGDPLLTDGNEARKVPLEFAKGYTKGVSDQIKRSYWVEQQNQRTKQEANEGHIRYYNATIPEHEDGNGTIRVSREITIPIVE
jgi:hypothetical protein